MQYDLLVPLGEILLARWELLIGHMSPTCLLLEIHHVPLLELEVLASNADEASRAKVRILL